ncbi:MAG: helix-turn-helix domain-containing protein [Pseudomonadota bacterium]
MSRPNKTATRGEELPELLSANEAADFLNLSPITLSHYRCQGRGPIYRKHGWRILYAKPDLVDWSNRQTWSSTSEKLQ